MGGLWGIVPSLAGALGQCPDAWSLMRGREAAAIWGLILRIF